MEQDSLVGQRVGIYLIQAQLGEGGMARVYKGYDPKLRRDVAIKVIIPDVAHQQGFRERFEREAQVIASLEHPHIVSVYGFDDQPITYLVMRYVGGGTLRNLLHGQRPLDMRQAVLYAHDMAEALHHAHQRGIIHRDVKPQNMLISTNEKRDILLSDFGIAKLFQESPTYTTLTAPTSGDDHTLLRQDPQLTGAGQLVGTAEYMAPEQINQRPVDARTDVYALGVVLFQMLTGQVPFQSSTLLGLLYQHVHTPAPSVRDLNPLVPESLVQITTKALSKRPEERFQSAGEFAQALGAILPPTPEELHSSFSGYSSSPFTSGLQSRPPQSASARAVSPAKSAI